MSNASIENWLRLMREGEIKNKTVVVLYYITKHPDCTIVDLRTDTKMPHQTITAIVSQLMDEGAVKFSGERKIGANTYSTLRFVEGSFNQNNEKQIRRKEKFNLWLKQGADYKDLMSSNLVMALTVEAAYND